MNYESRLEVLNMLFENGDLTTEEYDWQLFKLEEEEEEYYDYEEE